MNLSVKLIIEKNDKSNIWYACQNNTFPAQECLGCPKKKCAEILREITGFDINPYDIDWLSLELCDTSYDNTAEIVYIIYVCRVPPDTKISSSYEWKPYNEVHNEIQLIKGVF